MRLYYWQEKTELAARKSKQLNCKEGALLQKNGQLDIVVLCQIRRDPVATKQRMINCFYEICKLLVLSRLPGTVVTHKRSQAEDANFTLSAKKKIPRQKN